MGTGIEGELRRKYNMTRVTSGGVDMPNFVEGIQLDGTTLVPSEMNVLDGVTGGTVTASKAVVVDSNKDIGDFRNLDAVNIDAGSSGVVGTVDVFPTTADRGKLALTCANQTGDTTVGLNIEAMGQATAIGVPDPGAASAKVALSTAALTLAEVDVLDGAVAGTNAESKVLLPDSDNAIDTLGLSAGAAAAAVAMRFGASSTEGLEVRVIDETVQLTNAVETDLTETVPDGAVILSAQSNLEATLTGEANGDDGQVKIGISVTGDPNKYGLTPDLIKDSKSDAIPDWAVLSGAETVTIKAADTNGAAVTELFTGGAGQDVRVRIIYLALNSLDNAPV